jgi:hypothetical protein
MTEYSEAMNANLRQVKAMDWPADGSADDKLLFLLNYAVLAPSILNAEPWRFELGGGSVTLSEDRTRRLGAVDPDGREAMISCGAALFNLRAAARSFGAELEVELRQEEEAPALASISLSDAAARSRER